ncbi:MAG: sulfatase-like hydrolase/transferase [Candidatus Promineifilaceae bacterium]|nr:sulfatase-like hydrolase/transferase [Candidatus Promineifilaceae bacterium]
MARRPNIILILSDNHPAELLGCYGNSECQTPHLDRLAAQGLRFDQAYSVNAMCSPCRATILTGLIPSQHGIHTWLDDRLMDRWPPDWNAIAEFVTLPELLKQHGYRTALIGKYHLGVPDEPQNGFDYWLTFPLGHTRSFWNNTIIDNGQRYTYAGHVVDCFTEKAVAYIREQATTGSQPFFLYLPYNAPYGHWPSIQGPARNRFAARYAETPMHSIPREGLSRAAIERFLLRRAASGGGIDYSAHLRLPNDLTSLRNYFSQMSMVDEGVGRVLAALAESGLEDETLVIYSCDHGFSLGHHGFWGHGQATWPANAHRQAYHVGLLARHPGHIAPGGRTAALVGQADLFATLLDYVGLGDVQANPDSPGRSFAPLLRGERLSWPADEVFIEQEELRALRTSEWLYMRRFQGSETYPLADALFDLTADPHERRDLIAQPAYAETVRTLRQRVDAYYERFAQPRYDLWQGGSLKSNTDKPWLWRDVWGEKWRPVF